MLAVASCTRPSQALQEAVISIAGPGAPDPLRQGLARLEGLPAWLVGAVDPDRVGASLARLVPELAAGAVRLAGVQIHRPVLEAAGWTARYLLSLQAPGGRRWTLPLLGTIRPPGMPPACAAGSGVALGDPRWQCAIPELNLGLRSEPPDTALPALPQLTDPVKACALLQGGLAAGAPVLRGLRLAGCTPRLLRYHPGSRCTIAYGLRYGPDAPPGWPDQVIAKAYADDQAGAAWTAMRVLWRSTLADHPMVALAEPLAWLAPLRVVVQRWLPGMQPLDRLVRASVTADAPAAADALEPAVRAAAEALAALHHTDVRHGPEVSLLDELAATRATLAQLARLTPGPDTWAAPLLDRIAGDAAALPADPARPAHRSFHPAQLLLDPARQRVGIIDFDGLCMAEPALDVARFRAALRYLGRQRPRGADPATGQRDPDLPDRLDRIADAFLDQYQAVAPVSRARVWLWETLDLFGYVLHCWTKARPHRARDTVQLLRRHLDAGRAARPT